MTDTLKVTQADKEAARAAQADMIVGGFQGDKEVWRKVEQAFARHRTSSTRELVEALENAASGFEAVNSLLETIGAGRSIMVETFAERARTALSNHRKAQG